MEGVWDRWEKWIEVDGLYLQGEQGGKGIRDEKNYSKEILET